LLKLTAHAFASAVTANHDGRYVGLAAHRARGVELSGVQFALAITAK
jgi:hypothetical protein